MAKTIKGVSPEREAYMKGQQERGVTVRNGVSPQRQAYMDSIPNDEVIEAKPVNANRTNMMQRPLTSRIPRIGSNPLDINQIRGVASDMVNNGNYQHPEYKAKLQAMFPKPKLALGGIVNANQSMWNESYKQRPDMFHDNLSFDNMTTDGTDNASPLASKQTKPMSIMNALALKENRASSGFENMTTDGYKKGGVVKKSTETNRQRLGAINYKEGGTIKGPGTGTSDSIDANLPVGSAIIPASVLKLYGEDFFDKLEAIAHSPDDNEEAAEAVSHTSLVKPTLGMKCGGVAKMKEGGIALQVKPTPPIKGMKAGMPDYGYGDRYEEPNSKTIVRPKAQGYFGDIVRADNPDDESTELGQNMKGYGEVPAINPSLTKEELTSLVSGKPRAKFPDSIDKKAQSYAAFRKLNGQSPFAGINDKPVLLPSDNEKMIGDMTSNVAPVPGSRGLKPFAKGGVVKAIPAKVSNGERYLTPEAVKFFGQKFVNTLIHASPNDVKEEMGEVKGGKVHAMKGLGFDADKYNQEINKGKNAKTNFTNNEALGKSSKSIPASKLNSKIHPLFENTGIKNINYPGKIQGVTPNPVNPSISNLAKDAGQVLKRNAGRVAGPAIAAATEGYNTYQDVANGGLSDTDKAARIAEGVGRTASTIAGGEIGAGLGTMVAPGLGTVAGGLLGAGAGYVAPEATMAFSNRMLGRNDTLPSQRVKRSNDNVQQPTAQVQAGQNRNVALPNNQPSQVTQPQPNKQVIKEAIPQIGSNLISNSTFDASMPVGDQSYVAPLPKAERGLNPKSTDTLQVGNNYVQSNIPGNTLVKGKLGRQSTPESMALLNDTINRNADPAFQARLAEQAQIVNDRMAWAKQNDLERNARLGNKAAADTLKAQADTKQAQLAAQVEANKLGYNREADAAKLAQEKELKGRELDIQENKPITIDERNPEGLVIGTKVLGKTKDKEGKVSYNNLAQNADNEAIAKIQEQSPEAQAKAYQTAFSEVQSLKDKDIKSLKPDELKRYQSNLKYLNLYLQMNNQLQ